MMFESYKAINRAKTAIIDGEEVPLRASLTFVFKSTLAALSKCRRLSAIMPTSRVFHHGLLFLCFVWLLQGCAFIPPTSKQTPSIETIDSESTPTVNIVESELESEKLSYFFDESSAVEDIVSPPLFASFLDLVRHKARLGRATDDETALSRFVEAVNQDDIVLAEELQNQMHNSLLNSWLANIFLLNQTRLQIKKGYIFEAHSNIRNMENNIEQHPHASEVFQIFCSIYRHTGDRLALLEYLVRGARYVNEVEFQDELIDLLSTLTSAEHRSLKEVRSHPDFAGWVEFVRILKNTSLDRRHEALSRWRAVYFDHPLHSQIYDQANGQARDGVFDELALLLPVSSAYSSVALAISDGVSKSQKEDSNPMKVKVYDIGEDVSLSGMYYDAAVKNGAEFVIGPLGSKAIRMFFRRPLYPVDLLVVGDTRKALVDNLGGSVFGVAVSTEHESEAAAQKAFSMGYRRALVLADPEDSVDVRGAFAFQDEWAELGGEMQYVEISHDFSEIIRKIQDAFSIKDSKVRRSLIEDIVGHEVVSTSPENDHKIDVVFFASTPELARLLVPQIRFTAYEVPIFSTSRIYQGPSVLSVNADLDGVIFQELSAMLQNDQLFYRLQKEENDRNKDSLLLQKDIPSSLSGVPRFTWRDDGFSELDRYYILGMELYQVASNLRWSKPKKHSKKFRYRGKTGVIYHKDGHVFPAREWVSFRGGRLKKASIR